MAGGLSKPYRWLSKPRRVAAPLSRLAERGPATWPSAAPSRGHLSSFNAKTRNASEISLAFRVFLSRLWESNPRPIHYE